MLILSYSVYHEPSIMIQSAKFGHWDFCTACAKPHLWPVVGDAPQVTSTVQAEGNLRAQYLAFLYIYIVVVFIILIGIGNNHI